MQNSSYLCLQSAEIGVSLQVISLGSSQGPSNGLCHHLPQSPTATKYRLQIKRLLTTPTFCVPACPPPFLSFSVPMAVLLSVHLYSFPRLSPHTHTPIPELQHGLASQGHTSLPWACQAPLTALYSINNRHAPTCPYKTSKFLVTPYQNSKFSLTDDIF